MLLLSCWASAETLAQGIRFESLSFEEALVKAKAENKFVFVDFHTEWCAPCKAMAKNEFTQKKAGDVYNKLYINLQLDAEKEGKELAKKCEVQSYPTFIYFNADGEIMYRMSGLRGAEEIAQTGKKVEQSRYSNYSKVKLEEAFDERKNDEDFLKMYIQKMKEYGLSASKGIEAWLAVQTEYKENYAEVMEFLIENKDDILLGGNAQRILDENYDEYFAIATRLEEIRLKSLKAQFARNTLNQAYQHDDPELLRLFLVNAKQMEPDQDWYLYDIDYLLFKGDMDAYKRLAEQKMDSIMAEETIEKDAARKVKTIHRVSKNYLKHCSSKKEFKAINQWIDFALELQDTNATSLNYKSEILKKQGKIKEAIAYKKATIENLTDKEADRSKEDLEQDLKDLEALRK